MPRREGGFQNLHELPWTDRLQHNGTWQHHWYHHIGALIAEEHSPVASVLDVGAGDGSGLACLLDHLYGPLTAIDPVPASAHVRQGYIEEVGVAAADFVLAIDVLEHVEADRGFLRELSRVARHGVFISTPNWNKSGAVNEFHVREYTPLELTALLDAELPGRRRAWISDDFCELAEVSWPYADDEWAPNFGVLTEFHT